VLALLAVANAITLDVKLTAPESVDLSTTPLMVDVHFTNPAAHPVAFSIELTPLEGMFEDLFDIRSPSGVPLHYIGKVAFRSGNDTTAILLPGATTQAVVDLSESYHFEEAGLYTITLRDASEPLRYVQGAPTVVAITGKTPEPPAPVPYLGCSQPDQNIVNTAWSGGQQQATRGNNCVQQRNQCGNLQTTWFGQTSAGQFQNVQRCWSTARQRMHQTGQFQVNCRPTQHCTGGTIAYVYPTDANRVIYLCASFFTYSERPRVMVHEVTHFNVICGTRDHGYGRAACQNLARSNPQQAITNADNYAYFGMDSP